MKREIRAGQATGRFNGGHPNPRHLSLRGFTLIELLVVISIIALLVGILLPALGSARRTALRMKCASNMRQVATAVFIYENDARRLPGRSNRAIRAHHAYDKRHWATAFPGQIPEANFNLPWRMRDYLDTGWRGTPGVVDATDTGEIPDHWQCPLNEDAKDLVGGLRPGESYLFLLNSQNDSDPIYFFGAPNGSENNPKIKEPSDVLSKRLDDIKAGRDTVSTPAGEDRARGLSSIWMMSDIDNENYAFGSDLNHVNPAHNKGEARNYVFFDGHTSLLSRNDWPTNTSNAQ